MTNHDIILHALVEDPGIDTANGLHSSTGTSISNGVVRGVQNLHLTHNELNLARHHIYSQSPPVAFSPNPSPARHTHRTSSAMPRAAPGKDRSQFA